MKKFRLALLAFIVTVITFVFTMPVEKNNPTVTFYAFDSTWTLLDSTYSFVEPAPCPEPDQVLSARIWEAIKDGHPGRVRIMDLLKPYLVPVNK